MNCFYRNALKNINYGLRFYSSDTSKVVVPKQPLSSFLIFCKERRETSYATGSPQQFLKESGEIWSNLSEAEKQPYIEQGNLAQAKYRNELESLSDFEMDEIKRERKEKRLKMEKKREKMLQKKLGLPRRGSSAYSLFLADQLRGKTKSKILFQETAKKWKNLTESEKQVYHENYLHDKARYEREMEIFVNNMIENKSEYLIPQSHLGRRLRKNRLIEKGAKLEESLNKVREDFDKL